MQEKTRKAIQKACDIIELCIAPGRGAGTAGVGDTLHPPGGEAADQLLGYRPLPAVSGRYVQLHRGVEFIKMLCKPSAENVIEVLVFLVARHMILGTNSAVDILLSVLAVALLYGTRLLLRHFKRHSTPEISLRKKRKRPSSTIKRQRAEPFKQRLRLFFIFL